MAVVALLTTALLLSMATPGSAALTNVAAWDFDGDLDDQVTGYNGTNGGGAEFSTDTPNPVGGAGYDYAENRSLYLTGDGTSTDDEYVRVDSTTVGGNPLAFSDDLTLAMWIKTSGSDQRILYFCGKSGHTAYNYQVYTSAGKVTLGLRQVAPTQDWDFVPTLAAYNDGNWHHFVYTNDGATSKVYVDGSLENTVATHGYNNASGVNYPMDFGRQTDGAVNFVGYLDEIQIIRGLADATDVATMYEESVNIPEPVTMAVLACGLLAVLVRRRGS